MRFGYIQRGPCQRMSVCGSGIGSDGGGAPPAGNHAGMGGHMGVARTPGSRRSRPVHHSIRFTFVTTVIVPVVCLVAVWALLVAFVPGGGLAGHGSSSSGHHGFAEVAVQAGGGLIVVVAAAVLMSLFTRRLTREVTGLAATARHTAEAELPRLLANLRGEELPGGDSGFTPPPGSIGEIAG